MTTFAIWALLALSAYMLFLLRQAHKQLRTLGSFVNGILHYIQKTPAMIDESLRKVVDPGEVNGHDILLKDLKESFEVDEKEFWNGLYGWRLPRT